MPSTSAPFGLEPYNHASGQVITVAGPIASGYASTIYKHAPVKMLADGTIGVAAAGDALIGTFLGVRYIDSTGKPVNSNYWPASTVATDIVAFYTRDPGTLYKIQASATLAQTAVGNNVDFTVTSAGSAALGTSACMADAATLATTSAQLQIVGFANGPHSAAGDTYPWLVVRIYEHQLSAIPTAGV